MARIFTPNGWKWNVEQLNRCITSVEGDVNSNTSNITDILTTIETLQVKPNNLVFINQESDFPTQDATTITLEQNTAYLIGDSVSTAKRFIVEDGVTLTSPTPFGLTLQYTGSGVMFTSVNANWAIYDLRFDCPNGTLFDYTGSGIHLLERSVCNSCVNVGTFTAVGATSVNWVNVNFSLITGNGQVFVGDFFVLSITKMFRNSTSASYIGYDITSATFQTVELRDVEMFGVTGGISLKGSSGSTNIVANSIATVESCNLSGGDLTSLSGITPEDVRWDFQRCSKIADTLEDALIYFNDNVTETTITATSSNGSNAVPINAVWQMGRLSKFTADSTGLVTYIGERPITVPVDMVINVIGTVGASRDINIYLCKNDITVPETKRGDFVTNTRSKQLYAPWQMTFEQGDTIRIKIENEDGTDNLICQQGMIRIR